MAKFETLEQDAVCPCGQGRVHRIVYSPNYPFGHTTLSDADIQCPVCRLVWRTAGTQERLFHQERDQWPGRFAQKQISLLISELLATVRSHQERALLHHLHTQGARSKAAQHRVLKAEKLYAAGYQTYLRGGFASAVSAFDAKRIPECSATLQQLANTRRALEELNKSHHSWLQERRHRVEFDLTWQYC